jgi:hypothetical protein
MKKAKKMKSTNRKRSEPIKNPNQNKPKVFLQKRKKK